jgi:uncharacterized phosphosugar-binding protein
MQPAPFLSRLIVNLSSVAESQHASFELVSGKMADCLADGGLVHLFGSGHSVMPTLDAYPRYGSYVGLNPVNDPRLMWHNVLGPGGVRELLWLERTEGYIVNFLSHEALRAGDVMIVYSHGGRNAAPIEAALYAKDQGLWVVAVTSKATMVLSRPHSSGKHLADVADAVIDTLVPVEDASVPVPGWNRPVSGASTVVAMACTQELIARTALKLAVRGITLPTFVSPTVPGATVASNDEVFEAHRQRLAKSRLEWVKETTPQP